MRTFLKYAMIVVPIFLAISGAWLLFAPWLWVDSSGGPHDLIVNASIDPSWNPGCTISNGHVSQSCRSLNVTIGKSVVTGAGGYWHATNETIDARWVQVTAYCSRVSSLVMITVKNGHLLHFTGQAFEAYDPPQFMDSSYNSYHQNSLSGC